MLTGFLGSGKTTLLNHLLHQPEMANTLVIMNEFGAIGLDHLLVAHNTENQEVMAISGGCICCNLRSDLKKTLKDIGWRFSREGRKQFNRVLIETTGLADPATLLHTIMTDEYIKVHYHLESVVATFDAINGIQTLSKHYEAHKQLAIADGIIITKTDLISDAFLMEIKSRLLVINPPAKYYEVQHGKLACDKLLNISLLQKLLDSQLSNNAEYAQQIKHWLRSDYYLKFRHAVQDLDEEAHHHDDIASFSFSLDAPISLSTFDTMIALLMKLNGDDLLRTKGIINFVEHAKPMALHGVQQVFHPLIELPEWPSQDRRTHLVFITHDIAKEILEDIVERAFGIKHFALTYQFSEDSSASLAMA